MGVRDDDGRTYERTIPQSNISLLFTAMRDLCPCSPRSSLHREVFSITPSSVLTHCCCVLKLRFRSFLVSYLQVLAPQYFCIARQIRITPDFSRINVTFPLDFESQPSLGTVQTSFTRCIPTLANRTPSDLIPTDLHQVPALRLPIPLRRLIRTGLLFNLEPTAIFCRTRNGTDGCTTAVFRHVVTSDFLPWVF